MEKKIKLMYALVVALLLSASCKEEEKNNFIKEGISTQITNDQEEAKLLVQATQSSLNTIALCKLLEEESPSLNSAITQIRKEQEVLFQDFQKVATKNLVSIASKPSIEIQQNLVYDTTQVKIVQIFNEINSNLETQARVLDTLIENGDWDSKNLAKAYIKNIEQKNQIVEHALASLK
jgi:hypothetical protein